MDSEDSSIDHALIDLGEVNGETKGAGFVELDLEGTQKILMGLSDD